MSDTGGLSSNCNGWTNNLNLTNQRLLDPNNQLSHLTNLNQNELIASNLTNLNQINNASLYSSTADSNDSNDEDSRDSLRGSNSEINLNGDEGVWSPDIEQSFQEALTIYPPCGRRKIILSEEGKMYGRNELIARYIKLRTGKTRTRKQVSSHIQVLARRKQREHTTKGSSKQPFWSNNLGEDIKPIVNFNNGNIQFYNGNAENGAATNHLTANGTNYNLENNGLGQPNKTIASSSLRLLNLVAYLELSHNQHDQTGGQNQLAALNDSTNSEKIGDFKHIFVEINGDSIYSSINSNLINSSSDYSQFEDIDIKQICDKFSQNKNGLKDLYDKGPQDAFFLVKCWADLNINPISALNDPLAFFGTNTLFESSKSMSLICSTVLCSFGKQVVEKVEKMTPIFDNNRYIYRLKRSEMCSYMVSFILKLTQLPEEYMMNSVLENFTILQVITSGEKTVLCIAFVFEVSVSEHGAQHHIYRLTDRLSSAENISNNEVH